MSLIHFIKKNITGGHYHEKETGTQYWYVSKVELFFSKIKWKTNRRLGIVWCKIQILYIKLFKI